MLDDVGAGVENGGGVARVDEAGAGGVMEVG